MTTRAVVYVRMSEDRVGNAAGVTRQREDCLRRAEGRDWEVVAVETDNDVSAKGPRRRPGFEAVLRQIQSGEVDVVLAWALDRLTRNRRDELRLYEACRDRRVTLSLINGTDLDFGSAAGRFVADTLGSVARLEIELKADRQRRAVEQAIQQGRRVGGRRPFGYEQDGVGIREVEANAIRDGYRDFIAGASLAAVARDWNSRGLQTGQGSSFAPYSVRMVLRNPRNAGLRAHRGEVRGKAAWAALVPEDIWATAVAILANPARRTGGNGRPRLLSGIARCECGGRVKAGGGARQGVAAYRCADSLGHFARMAEPVEEFITDLVIERLNRPDARELLTAPSGGEPDLGTLQTELSGIEARLQALAIDYADGLLTREQMNAGTTRLRQRRAAIEATMADSSRGRILNPLLGAEDLRAAWNNLDIERQRAVVDLLFDITLRPVGRGVRTFRPETVGVEWRAAA